MFANVPFRNVRKNSGRIQPLHLHHRRRRRHQAASIGFARWRGVWLKVEYNRLCAGALQFVRYSWYSFNAMFSDLRAARAQFTVHQ